jgi:hypothetical protein
MASNYNRIPRPEVLFISNKEISARVRRETVSDMLATEH